MGKRFQETSASLMSPDVLKPSQWQHLGAGRFILNNLHIRENLGKVPAAGRLLRNLLRYAASARRTL